MDQFSCKYSKNIEASIYPHIHWIKLQFLGVWLIWPAPKVLTCWKDPNYSYCVENLKLSSMTTEKLSFKDETIFFPFSLILERSYMWDFFGKSSDELAFELSYKPKMKFLASLYRVLQAIFSFFDLKKMSQIRLWTPRIFWPWKGRFLFRIHS